MNVRGLKDKSPVIPEIGQITQSTLLQRRAQSKEELNMSYYKYDEYDNVPLQLSPAKKAPLELFSITTIKRYYWAIHNFSFISVL